MRRWTKIGAGVAASVTTILGLFFLLQSNFGFIITDQTGNFSCEGSYENPCISEFSVRNPTRYDVDIFNQDEIQLDFSPNIEDYALFTKDGRCSATGSCACTLKNGQRIGFKGWRCIDFTEDTKPIQDKVYVFRFPRYSTKEFRLVGIKKNPNDVVKWGFGANDEYLDPIWDAKIKSIRTPTTETISNQDGTKTLTLYSGIKFIAEDGKWKDIKDASSLKNSSIKCVVTKGKDDPTVECLDYNYTSIKIDVKDKKSYPIKIYYKNNTLKSEKAEKNLDIETINIKFGNKIHIGKQSTTIELTGLNVTADMVHYGLFKETIALLSVIKYNISLIPSSSSIISANAHFSVNGADESSNYGNNFNISRINNQTWDESNILSLSSTDFTTGSLQDGINASSGLKLTSLNINWIGTPIYYNVTDILKADYVLDNDFCSFVISDNETMPYKNYTFSLDEVEGLIVGFESSFGVLIFTDREDTDSTGYTTPFLNITYIDDSTTCNYPGSGNWDIDCSDNCFINSSISINGNLSLLGSGTIRLNSTLDFNSTGQRIVQGSGCSFVVNSGGKIS